MQTVINLKAGVWVSQHLRGLQFAINSYSVATSMKCRLIRGSEVLDELTASRKFSAMVPGGFDRVELCSSVDCQVDIIVSNSSVRYDFSDGATVNANILGTVPVSAPAPLAVVNDRGAPGQPVYVSGLTYSDAPATSVTDGEAVAVGAAVVNLVTANAARKSVRFLNLGPDPVAIGSTTLTWGKRTIVLDVGDVWEETRGANLAWSAICDAGKTASVTGQGVMA